MPAAVAPFDPRPWLAAFAATAFLWGASIGSFLNVCIHRIPLDLSVVTPRSHCPCCRHKIAWYHNVPLLTWPMLGGRCRYCGTAISPRYVLVELLVAVLFLLAWWKLALPGAGARPLHLAPVRAPLLVPVFWLALSGLVLGTFVDIEHLIIPDRVTLGGIAAGLALSVLVPELHGTAGRLQALGRAAVGAAAGWGALWLVAEAGRLVFRREAMGFGDVKLLSAIGAFTGWRGVVFAIVVSSLLGSLVGVALVAAGQRRLQSRIPYGPYLSLAAAVWIFWGPALWAAYLELLSSAP